MQLKYEIQKKKPTINIKEGVFYDDINDFYIKVGEKSKIMVIN